jgi:sugar phosphate isomerase/epimerase
MTTTANQNQNRQSRTLPGPWLLTGALCPAQSPFAPLLFAGRLDEGITALAELGYDAIELSLREPQELDVEGLQIRLSQLGLAVSSIGTGRMFYEQGLSFTSPVEEVRRQAAERLLEHLELAARLGAAVTVGGARGTLPRNDPAEAARLRQISAELVHKIGERADQLGVTLLVEPINRYETNFINKTEDGLRFLDEAGLPNARLLLDTFHMNIEEVSLAEAISMAGDRLGYVHLADSNRQAPHSGHTDLAGVLHALAEIGYQGYLGMEVVPLPDDYTAAQRGVENTSRLIREHIASQP